MPAWLGLPKPFVRMPVFDIQPSGHIYRSSSRPSEDSTMKIDATLDLELFRVDFKQLVQGNIISVLISLRWRLLLYNVVGAFPCAKA